MKRLFLFIYSFFVLSAANLCCAADAPQVNSTTTEDEVDLSSLKDPFISQLPKMVAQIVKTPVESGMQKIDNNPTQQHNATGIPMPVIQTTRNKKQQMPALELQGVVWGGERPEAIINGEVVSPGETIDKVKIESVSKDGVEVSFEGKTFYVHME